MAKRKTANLKSRAGARIEELEKGKSETASALAAIECRNLCDLGDKLAKENGYQSVSGIDAVRYFLMQKHNWTPCQVRAMSHGDLLFATAESS